MVLPNVPSKPSFLALVRKTQTELLLVRRLRTRRNVVRRNRQNLELFTPLPTTPLVALLILMPQGGLERIRPVPALLTRALQYLVPAELLYRMTRPFRR